MDGIYESRQVLAGTPTHPAKTAPERLSLRIAAQAAGRGRPGSGLINYKPASGQPAPFLAASIQGFTKELSLFTL